MRVREHVRLRVRACVFVAFKSSCALVCFDVSVVSAGISAAVRYQQWLSRGGRVLKSKRACARGAH